MRARKEEPRSQDGTAPTRAPGPAHGRRTGARLPARRPAPAAVAALQGSAGNQTAVRMLRRGGTQPVQRSSAPEALRFAGSPLAEHVRAEMEARPGRGLLRRTAAHRHGRAALGARAGRAGVEGFRGQRPR